MPLPLPVEPTRPTLSGHGGEIAHGFYYALPEELSEVRKGGGTALVDRLEKAARQKHAAAHRAAYSAYRDEVERALDEGRRHGLVGPTCSTTSTSSTASPTAPASAPAAAATRPAPPRPSSAPPSTSRPSSAWTEGSTRS